MSMDLMLRAALDMANKCPDCGRNVHDCKIEGCCEWASDYHGDNATEGNEIPPNDGGE